MDIYILNTTRVFPLSILTAFKSAPGTMRILDDYRALSGQEKAAILLLSLGEEVASKLFALMSDDEIKELSQTMAGLGTVNASIIERLIIEFADQISATGALAGTFDSAERFLGKVLDKKRAADILDEIRGPMGRTMWDKLANVNEAILSNYLKNEYPQTVAVVLSKIKPDHAARVLAAMPDAFAMEVVMRMLRMESVGKEVLEDVERVLRTEFMANIAKQNRRDTHEMMAEIFNALDRTTEARFATALEERNRDSAEKIRALMFKFEDLSRLDPGGVQTLLRAVDKSKLALALKGANDGLRDLFFSNMSERAGKLLKEEIEALGPVRARDVIEAQGAMINTAKDLAARDEIVLSKGGKGGDDDLIY
jgi:flagellar motor switch protein FliG